MIATNLETAHKIILGLIDDFEKNINRYLSPDYKEQEVRDDYINRFWMALGWDVTHENQKNPFLQEVKIEKAQTQEDSRAKKSADYAFYLAPNYKKEVFFVEAKKPSRTLRQNKQDYFQTAKYGWNAGTGVSVLTDFEEFVIIDCRYKPELETILTNEIKYYYFNEFKDINTFSEIYWIFSREAVEAGNLVTFIEKLQKSKDKKQKSSNDNSQTIDESFLNYIEILRLKVAQAYFNTNPILDRYELTELTQRTIDRFVFIKFLEDKNIEPYSVIQKIANSKKPWDKFVDESKRLNLKYNGQIFSPMFIEKNKNNITFNVPDNELFSSICKELDANNTPYDFNYFPIHILGNIYERFLGKSIFIENGKINVELKPEIRKAGGVFYTPKYIVDYIIENTIGKLINGKTPAEIADLSFADIACGSGSFLISIFEYLLDFHHIYYNDNPNIARKDNCNYDDENKRWILTIKQKQQILLNNIYGIDLDFQAIEVTQLSLFLKMLENVDMNQADFMKWKNLKILPDLRKNIISGNSLIEYDFIDGRIPFTKDEMFAYMPVDIKDEFHEVFKNKQVKQQSLSEIASKAKEHAQKAMEYATELESRLSIVSEPTTMYGKTGGFDVIVGNPPYYRVSNKELIGYFQKKFKHQNYQYDLYLLFLERYHGLLNNEGVMGIIIPNTWLQSLSFTNIRKYLVNNFNWKKILTSSKHIFDAVVDTHVIIFNKSEGRTNNYVIIEKLENEKANYFQSINQFDIAGNGEVINIMANPKEVNLFEKIKENSDLLATVSKVYSGITLFEKGKGTPPQTEQIMKDKPYIVENQPKPEGKNWLPLMRGSLMNRYVNHWDNNSWVLYGKNLAAPRDPKIFEAPEKIIIRQTGDSIIATIIESGIIARKNLHILISSKINHKFILGVLNSKLVDFYYQQINPEKGEALAEVKKNHIEQLPIPKLNKQNEPEQQQIIELVDKLIETKVSQKIASSDLDRKFFENYSTKLYQQINEIMYKMYDLTDEEVEMVEGC